MTIEHEILQYQIRRGVPETLSVTFYEDGGVTDPGTVTIGIEDEAGNEIVPSGTATSGTGADARTYDLAAQSDLNLLVVTWETASYGDLTNRVEVVGEQLFTLREARTFDNNALESESDYPRSHIEETRARITDEFKHAMSVSHIPRYNRVEMSGTGSNRLFLPDLYVSAVRTVEYRQISETSWTAFSAAEIDDLAVEDAGIIRRRTKGDWSSAVVYRVTYEYGYPSPPLAIKRAALRLLVSYVGATTSSWDPRQTSMSTEAGVISLATPGRAGSIFGLPEVDAVIHRYAERVPAIG